MKQLLLRMVCAFAALVALTYAGDYVSVRYEIPRGRDRFTSVNIQPYYAIRQKNGKTEYDFAPPEEQVCVRSLFPHFGYSPCWYVTRHAEKRIDI